MIDKSDLILRLLPENTLSSEVCDMRENHDFFNELDGYPVLALRFSCEPKNVQRGFVFGYDRKYCDILFKKPIISRKHFSINFNPKSGLIILVNKSTSGTVVGGKVLHAVDQTKVLDHRVVISFGSYRFVVDIPNRHQAQEKFMENQRLYLGNMHCGLTTVVQSEVTTPNHIMKEIGPYFEVSRLDEGSYGETSLFCTRDKGDLFVAKRLIATKGDARIMHEARTLHSLSHQNIVEFKSLIEEPTALTLVMEYLPHGSLHSGRIGSSFAALKVVEQSLQGLKYIHSKGFIHRDIKPENIILMSTVPVHIKIIDFGLATMHNEIGICGTLAYCAPDMWRNYIHTQAVDIWSLGMIVLDIDGNQIKPLADKYLVSTESANFEMYFDAIRQMLPTSRNTYSKLLRRMLDENPNGRYTAKECLKTIDDLKVESGREH